MRQKIILVGILSLTILGVGCSKSAENKATENEKVVASPVANASPSPGGTVGNKNNGSSASVPAASPASPTAGTPKSHGDDDRDEKEGKDDLKKRHKGK